MRIVSTIVAVLTIAAFAACSHGNSSSSSSTSTEASPEASAAAPAAGMSASGSIPSYPGATSEVSETTANGSGQVLSTNDAFVTVYKWYQTHLPAGSEKAHASMGGMETATFQVGKSSIAITTYAGKTQITIGTTP